jgi:hypothetical protein
MILTSLEVDSKAFEDHTGWALKPEGACKGDVCVPLPQTGACSGTLDARIISQRLGMPLIHDADAAVWCLGPEAMGHALTTAKAPELELPDWQGTPFRLSSLRGQKVLIVTWSSW